MKKFTYSPTYFDILILILISFGVCLIVYVGFGGNDNNEQLPQLFRMIDSSYLENDWYTNANSENFSIRYYFHYLMILLFNVIPNFAILYFLIYFFVAFFIGLAAYYISLNYFNNKNIALITAFFIIFGSNFYLGFNSMLN